VNRLIPRRRWRKRRLLQRSVHGARWTRANRHFGCHGEFCEVHVAGKQDDGRWVGYVGGGPGHVCGSCECIDREYEGGGKFGCGYLFGSECWASWACCWVNCLSVECGDEEFNCKQPDFIVMFGLYTMFSFASSSLVFTIEQFDMVFALT
jgi:hypothetical protein